MSPDQKKTIEWSRVKAIVGSTLLGLLPYLERAVYQETDIDLLGALYPWWILVVFAALGALAGAMFMKRGALGGIVSCAIALSLLTALDFIGNGGDGDLFYLFAAFGSTIFSLFALIAGALRKFLVQSRS